MRPEMKTPLKPRQKRFVHFRKKNPQRMDKHSSTGLSGSAKKHGAGGKWTWGDWTDDIEECLDDMELIKSVGMQSRGLQAQEPSEAQDFALLLKKVTRSPKRQTALVEMSYYEELAVKMKLREVVHQESCGIVLTEAMIRSMMSEDQSSSEYIKNKRVSSLPNKQAGRINARCSPVIKSRSGFPRVQQPNCAAMCH
ncbi:hypothetical protein CYMTET_37666 [Cymbomonas tetramitiformis]|uniref:Uncharacterized protein n=1 Tax=Cymbomonas tetramitiformis TaxID=36881 RepID=A0AAE0CFP0_9CHLO|nr:hypothetical protein CYMTET_37666 [Cymbomonas tetramitiformis]